MGSPLSPVIADIVMQDLEVTVLKKINLSPTLYYRYVDDIIMAAPSASISDILVEFNNYHNRLKFTIEHELDGAISFLDLRLKSDDNNLTIDWFHKKTSSGRYLSFFSNHPMCHKIGMIYSLVDRALTLADPFFHTKNIEYCINVLIENGYPLPLIFKEINRRIRVLHNRKENINTEPDDKPERKIIVLPYIQTISSIAKKHIDRSKFMLGYRCVNRLTKYINTHKDKIERTKETNVVYKIPCEECNVSYVGQTKRRLNTRLKEHMNNARLEPSRHSVLTQHMAETNHTMDWKKASILDKEPLWQKRIISEMIHIKEQENSINLQKDTESLDGTYFDLLKKLSNFKE
ncbi:PREDICTED: uncharacterized protein LOC105565077 [Vollenhovia emeryi]|uniref:uncharacterized protein LOC105565077 n=1 Tax=Vollenhovia emeryi TaxID=411798 RepID=UPI0005F37E9C|nr:PREDICTED: uncharacterized protein LOC105565077 [Vollenhovia emeryi]